MAFKNPGIGPRAFQTAISGLFAPRECLPPCLRELCVEVARALHVDATLVVAHLLPIAQALVGLSVTHNKLYKGMVRCAAAALLWGAVDSLACVRVGLLSRVGLGPAHAVHFRDGKPREQAA
jgi:hypothetical protein